jgi:ligand-binding sensor domain-containing protein
MGPLFLAADGALWFATEEGVIRDPQMEFKLTNPVTEALAEQKAKIEKEFPNVAPSPLNAKDAKGRIWVGREDGVDVYDGKTWTTMPLELGEATLSLVKADSKGRIWIGTQGAGLIGFEGDRQVRYNRDPQQGGAYVYSLTENRNGTLFASTQGGLFIQEGEACRRQEGLEELGCQQIVLIAADDKDRIWMADGNYGLFLFDGKSTRHLSQKDPLQGRQVVDLLPLKDGKMRVKTLSRAEKGTEEKSFDCDGRQCLPVAE